MSILDLFAKSPFRPLQEHMDVVLECVSQTRPLFEALVADDADGVRSAWRAIDELEGRADRLKNDLRSHLPKRLFLPVDRRDLLDILDRQDSMADAAQDVGELLSERPMPVPASLRAPLSELVDKVIETCEQCSSAIHLLDELLELGFRGREADQLESRIDRVGELEGQTDDIEASLRRELFQIEGELPPVSAMLWYQLIGWIGNIADHAEKVGNRLRLLIAT